MAYLKVPKRITVEQCEVAIEELLTEGVAYLGKEKFEKSAACFLKIAQIVRSIPELRRRKLVDDLLRKKQLRELKKRGLHPENIKEIPSEPLPDNKQVKSDNP
jgi:hypothetical protein